MVRVVIYGEKPADIEGLEKMLCEILTENRRWPMIHTYISDLDAYLHFVKGNPYLIMLASVQGRQGVEIVEKIRENNPAASLIWLSGRDNALESWRLHVTAFGVFPTKKEELEELLAACSESLLDRKKKYFVQVGNRLK
ncbi:MULTISPECIES: hypothetical protein [unclassified Clostridium]|uniref:hypothetical protein n=3 Tax=Clostridium TaxID=1485 RepID=UPI0003399A34|nr:hypothetical protein [Clostridium sp. CAG:43]CDD54719.1 putative uncharacterized protein [Clostridium sp. CAG:43]